MRRTFRLTHAADFKRVRLQGRSYAHPLVVLIALASDQPGTRIGVAAGRTVGSAVHRNRAKRLMRAAVRPLQPGLLPGWDLVLIARPPLATARMPEVRTALTTLFQRAKLLKRPDAA